MIKNLHFSITNTKKRCKWPLLYSLNAKQYSAHFFRFVMSLSLLSNTKSYKQSPQSLDNKIEFIGKCLAIVTSVTQKQHFLYVNKNPRVLRSVIQNVLTSCQCKPKNHPFRHRYCINVLCERNEMCNVSHDVTSVTM